jgi:hypothetical protein
VTLRNAREAVNAAAAIGTLQFPGRFGELLVLNITMHTTRTAGCTN